MTLYETLNNARRFAWNIPKLIEIIWRELKGLDERINDVEAGTVAEGSINTAELADDAVTSAKMALFVSTEQTGDGTAQAIAHGLGVSPSTVMILMSSIGADGATYTYTKGTTNVNVTATTGAKYFVVAIV